MALTLFTNNDLSGNTKRQAHKTEILNIPDSFTVEYPTPRIISCVLFSCILFCLLLFLIHLRIWTAVPIILVFLGVIIFAAWKTYRQKIVVYGDEMLVTPIFGETRKVSFYEIASVRESHNSGFRELYAYDHQNRRLFFTDSSALNFPLLDARLSPYIQRR